MEKCTLKTCCFYEYKKFQGKLLSEIFKVLTGTCDIQLFN